MSERVLHFYFEFSSPYGYIASELVDAFAATHSVAVTWHPFLIGAAFKVAGTTKLLDIPMKGDYSKHDIIRLARYHNIPYTLPDAFPLNSVAAARAFYWCQDAYPDKAVPLAKAIYRYAFAEGGDFKQPETIGQIATGIGLDAAETVEGLAQQAVKDRLRGEVDTALQNGVFGSPFFIYDEEPFWGVDHMEQLGRWIDTGGW